MCKWETSDVTFSLCLCESLSTATQPALANMSETQVAVCQMNSCLFNQRCHSSQVNELSQNMDFPYMFQSFSLNHKTHQYTKSSVTSQRLQLKSLKGTSYELSGDKQPILGSKKKKSSNCGFLTLIYLSLSSPKVNK